MPKHTLDQLFLDAEQLASEFSLFPSPGGSAPGEGIAGLIGEERIRRRLAEIEELAVDEYVRQTVEPVEDPSRPGIRAVIKRLRWPLLRQLETGPLWAAEFRISADGVTRRIGLLAQDRSHRNGAWMPEHHHLAVDVVRDFATRLLPVITIIDTPGADASAEANRDNQAHSISRLIAEMAQLHVPTVGIIFGNGYSGGAIPLATTNILLSMADGVFNTIQPRGLANIARKYNLSWQECAKAVGVSPYELWEQGYLDGIIDYSPLQGDQGIENLERAILSSLMVVEDRVAEFVAGNESVFEHYRRTVDRFLTPTRRLQRQQSGSLLSTLDEPTQQPNVFGVTYRYLRYLGLRRRITSTTVEAYGRLSTTEIPTGDLAERLARENEQTFQRWLDNPLKIRYDDVLQGVWKSFLDQRAVLGRDRGAVTSFLLGSREANYRIALSNLVLELAFHLYNTWKSGAGDIFPLLVAHLREVAPETAGDDRDTDVLALLSDPDVQGPFLEACRHVIVFDAAYDRLIGELKSVAPEAMDSNRIARGSVGALLESAIAAALPVAARSAGWSSDDLTEDELRGELHDWIRRLVRHKRRGVLLKSVADWKKAAFPTVSEPLFALITFFFERLLSNYYGSEDGGRYDGRIRPRNIGIKDFWNRLDRAYKDLLIQEVLNDVKRRERLGPEGIFGRFFTDVDELDRTLMTSDPVSFPGFRISIEEALEKELVPCGTVTALASFVENGISRRVGVLVSNRAFQAGSFDMASGVKFCRLLVSCARRRMPVICFITSGGMQTKEGAGSLFSMAIVNDRITRFVRDNDLPVLVFGFGDCTGGAQASMVTHPLVETYYFSGCSMPFAGQIVVPSHLPMTSVLSNYLSEVPGAMHGLVEHPFAEDLDDRLAAIDPAIPRPALGVEEVIRRVLEGKAPSSEAVTERHRRRSRKIYRPLRRMLVHARGCTAVRLVEGAQQHGIEAVLVQSDPDMESVAARRLRDGDALVCLGGSTPDESYLNALSVIRIATAEGCDSLHPGIGFLSESAAFADLCAQHDLNFVGPSAPAMERTGNKSNAVQTAMRLGIPVIPGSHGVVTTPEAAVEIAEEVGYPIVIKAVHGGGGRGIRRVDSSEELHDAFQLMAAEALSAFGGRDLYVEKLVQRFRHVEVQVLRDSHGTTKVLGLRDCSVQRARQKVVEESRSTLLTKKLRQAVFEHSAKLADAVDYVGAGTVEFIFDLDAKAVYFMEMNARLQVEHPVTEAVTGIDIVGEQLRIAAGESLAELEVGEDGYAIEVRINAERITRDGEGALRIVPDPGTVETLEWPEVAGVRVLAGIEAGGMVSPYYDSLLAQVIAHAKNRKAAIELLREFLAGVHIEGVGSNVPLLRRILADPELQGGDYDTTYLEGLLRRTGADELIAEVETARGVGRAAIDRSALEIEGGDELKVIAPSAGIFYAAPTPGQPDFVSVGDRIDRGTTLCLLEAMKVFEEISLEDLDSSGEVFADGKEYEVVRVSPRSGELVTEGDLLFVVRPVASGSAVAEREES